MVSSQNRRGSGVNVTEEQVFEHERFMPLAGWNSRHLLPTERNRYSRQEVGVNSTNQFPQMRLPQGGILPTSGFGFCLDPAELITLLTLGTHFTNLWGQPIS